MRWLPLVVLAGCAAPQVAAEAPAAPRALRVMTYNVNYGIPGDGETMDAIAVGDADVAFLQETTAAWETALRKRFAKRYPHMAFRHCCGAGGLGVMSVHPFEERAYTPSEKGWFPAWRLVVDTPDGPVQALNLHLRPPVSESGSVVSGLFSTPPIRRAEIEQHVAGLDPELPTVIVGDFNESHGPAVRYLVRRGFRSGLQDTPIKQSTWRWPTSVGTVSTQLDHIVYDTKHFRPRVVDVIRKGRSDHMPVVGELERKR